MHFTHASSNSTKSVEFFGNLGRRKNKRPTIIGNLHPDNAQPGHTRHLTPTFNEPRKSAQIEDQPSPLLTPAKATFHNPDRLGKILITEPAESDLFLSTQRTSNDKLVEHEHGLSRAKSLVEIGNLMDSDGEDEILEDGNRTKLEFQKLQIMDLATTLIAFIGGFLTVLTYDVEYEQTDDYLAQVLLWTLLGSTVVAIFLNFIRYLQKIKFFKARYDLSRKDNLFTTGDIWCLLFETFILLLQPYPFLRNIKLNDNSSFIDTNYYYYLNEIFSILIVCRIYLVIRCALNNLIYKSPRAYRVGDMYGSDTNYMYTIRCLMKVSPFQVVPIMMGFSIIVFGYMLRICERPLNRDPDVEIEFNSYWNAMWCVILTMTTVGYGDVYARTMLGRTVSFIMCMWGISIVSIMVVTLTNVLTLDAVEEKSLLVLRKLELKKKAKKEAAFVFTNIAKLGLIKKKAKTTEEQHKMKREIVKDIKKHLTTFKTTSRRIKGLDGTTGALEEVNRQVSNLREDVRSLMENQTEFQKIGIGSIGKKRKRK